MKSSDGRHGGNQGKADKHEADQAKGKGAGMAGSLSGTRDQDEAEAIPRARIEPWTRNANAGSPGRSKTKT